MKIYFEKRIAEIKNRLQKATSGPWGVYREHVELNDLGKKTFPEGISSEPNGTKSDSKIQLSIHTKWDHGQLDGPAPVVYTETSPFFREQTIISIRESDAEFIANCPEDIKFLLDVIDSIKPPDLKISQTPEYTFDKWWEERINSGYYKESASSLPIFEQILPQIKKIAKNSWDAAKSGTSD